MATIEELRNTQIESDLEEVINQSRVAFNKLIDRDILIPGGTGFVGGWLTSAICKAMQNLGGNGSVTVLGRRPRPKYLIGAQQAWPASVSYIQTDISNWAGISNLKFDLLINCAASSDETEYKRDPLGTTQAISDGTRNLLELLRLQDSARGVFMSSGAVYGLNYQKEALTERHRVHLPLGMSQLAYHETKRYAEMLMTMYRHQHGLNLVAARLFAFLGPGLPLERHFAAGNFMREAFNGETIRVRTEGLSARSYLYPTDMVNAISLLATAETSEAEYNIGSDRPVTVRELAETIAQYFDVSVQFDNEIEEPTYYVPDTTRLRKTHGFVETINLQNAISRTSNHLRQNIKPR
jgi:nucleoside-diphosphate-sugar epimerase